MYGEASAVCANTSLEFGVKNISCAVPPGREAGLAYFVPKPDDHTYALMYGLVACANATTFPLEFQTAVVPVPAMSVAGSEYLEPKPDDQAHAFIFGVPIPHVATTVPSGENLASFKLSGGNVDGLEYFEPKPGAFHAHPFRYGVSANAATKPFDDALTFAITLQSAAVAGVRTVPKPVESFQSIEATYGVALLLYATALPSAENLPSLERWVDVTVVVLAYFVPKPLDDHAYACAMYCGDDDQLVTNALPLLEKAK